LESNYELYRNIKTIGYQIEGHYKILDLTNKTDSVLIIKSQKFFNEQQFDFYYHNPESKISGYIFANLEINFPNIDEKLFVSIIIDKLLLSPIEKLRTNEQNKQNFILAIKKHVYKDYNNFISILGNLAENITQNLMKLLNKKWSNFGAAIKTMINTNPLKTVYKFRFLGCHLAPLYCLRNEVNHPDTKLIIDGGITYSAIYNLSSVLMYLSYHNINF
jgi:hypothetical protein